MKDAPSAERRGVIAAAISQPITVAVGTLLAVFAGILAVTIVPIRMTPEISSVVVSVTTNWESASAEEIESDIIEEQEKVLGEVTGLISLTSTSANGQGSIRMEFATGTDIEEATAEVLQKLDEVPGYPDGVLQPVVEPIDIESVDYIAWMGLSSSDPNFPAETLSDFMERRLRPRFERIDGISQVGVRGSVQSELHIVVDPAAMAQRGITFAGLRDAIRAANANFSGGKLVDGKRDVRVRATGRFQTPEEIEKMIIRRDEDGIVYLGDLATVRPAYKEPTSWVRARGIQMPFFNFQLERGANLLETMEALREEVRQLNAPDGLLAQKARDLGLNGTLELVQTYDSTTYVEDAITLVQSNILVGGILATLTLLFFLRSLRTVGIIALAIPVSVIASLIVLVALGRSINIISLAGLAFAVGMVVDNAIVVIENIFRHLEFGKKPRQAAYDGAKEVAGAVVASTMTTLIVFAPILLIQETAGQLFRDIALAIMISVGLSMVVSLTLIPTAAARFLHPPRESEKSDFDRLFGGRFFQFIGSPFRPLGWLFLNLPRMVGSAVAWLIDRRLRRFAVVAVFLVVTVLGVRILLPPLDYLPRGNRNVVFGLLFPPPSYNLDALSKTGERLEETVAPAWEATNDKFQVERVVRAGERDPDHDERKPVPQGPGKECSIMPPPLDHYFLVSFEGRMFQVAISKDKKRVVDAIPLLNHAASGGAAPDTFAITIQAPLFRVAGTTGSAINVDVKGTDLDDVSKSAAGLFAELMAGFGPGKVKPSPPNFKQPLEELRIVPDDERLRELGLTRSDLGLAVQAAGEGILLFRDYEKNGELKDMKIITADALSGLPLEALLTTPVATPTGEIVDLSSLASVNRVLGPDQIRHVDRLRAVTLEVTPPDSMPLEEAIDKVGEIIRKQKEGNQIVPGVQVEIAGSSDALGEIKNALLGDGSFAGLFTSSLFLALFVVYLLMVVLFQSWSYPLVIILSVPLATVGGLLGLFIVRQASLLDPYMPDQKMDVLTILGFVILAGVVVNNAILIVHQTINFMKDDPSREANQAICESVSSRVRPILMSTLTSVGGMLPLVLLPGSGSELYRGLGAVVVGGLVVSTVFTMFLVPTVLSVVFSFSKPKLADLGPAPAESN